MKMPPMPRAKYRITELIACTITSIFIVVLEGVTASTEAAWLATILLGTFLAIMGAHAWWRYLTGRP